MNKQRTRPSLTVLVVLVTVLIAGKTADSCAANAPAGQLRGQVMAAGAPIANSIVTLWTATASTPQQLAQARTANDGRFVLAASGAPANAILYLTAKGGRATASKTSDDNPAIGLLAILGSKPPARVTINEFTTIASVWTGNQFIEGTAIRGHPLGLRIAASNVPSFVNLETGGWGDVIQDPLNSSQTPHWPTYLRDASRE